MERYVNADEFLNLFHAVMESKGLSETDSWFCYRDLERVISATQTADVREVIRCKDCKHASSYWMEGTIFCVDSECPNFEDGFCNRAERRGGE